MSEVFMLGFVCGAMVAIVSMLVFILCLGRGASDGE